jgi:uncharacterized protein
MRRERLPTPRHYRDGAVEITPAIPGDRQVISGYAANLFRISGVVYDTSVLVFPDRTMVWPITSIADVTPESFSPIHEASPAIEVLLLGVGEQHVLVSSALRTALRAAGVVLDAMDTGAACRTYNVLIAEDRRVAAALIAIT